MALKLGREITDIELSKVLGLSSAEHVNYLINKGKESKRLLIKTNMRLVLHICSFYRNRGVAYPDLIQEGKINILFLSTLIYIFFLLGLLLPFFSFILLLMYQCYFVSSHCAVLLLCCVLFCSILFCSLFIVSYCDHQSLVMIIIIIIIVVIVKMIMMITIII